MGLRIRSAHATVVNAIEVDEIGAVGQTTFSNFATSAITMHSIDLPRRKMPSKTIRPGCSSTVTCSTNRPVPSCRKRRTVRPEVRPNPGLIAAVVIDKNPDSGESGSGCAADSRELRRPSRFGNNGCEGS